MGTAVRIFAIVAAFTAAAADFEYRPALPGYQYAFPRDHFEHPDFRTEWWYYTGNLRSLEGKRFGFELVFFRQGARRERPANPSAWRIDDLYLAHLALTDIDGKRYFPHERLNRAGPGLAGASFEKRRVWNGNWSAQWRGEGQKLEAVGEEFRL
jgi:predicted secreted hydrolase